MIDLRTIESVIITNTIISALSVVLLIVLIVLIILFLIPSIRRRFFQRNQNENNQVEDFPTLNRRTSSSSSRLNPIFEPIRETTPAPFGTLFHPQATTATLLHPTIWTSMTPTSVISSPLNLQPTTTTTTTTVKPPRRIIKKETS